MNRKSLQRYTFQKYKKNPKYQQTSNQKRITYLRGVKTLKKDSNYNIYRCAVHSQRAYMSQHEINARTKFPATDLEKGWIIDSGASAHMTPFNSMVPGPRNCCRNGNKYGFISSFY